MKIKTIINNSLIELEVFNFEYNLNRAFEIPNGSIYTKTFYSSIIFDVKKEDYFNKYSSELCHNDFHFNEIQLNFDNDSKLVFWSDDRYCAYTEHFEKNVFKKISFKWKIEIQRHIKDSKNFMNLSLRSII